MLITKFRILFYPVIFAKQLEVLNDDWNLILDELGNFRRKPSFYFGLFMI